MMSISIFTSYLNPYSGVDFIEFLKVLFSRVFLFCQGSLTLSDLASDEVQLLSLIVLAFSTSLVGSFLVLKRMTMMANAISHTILLGIVVAFMTFRFFHDPGVSTATSLSGTSLAGTSLAGGSFLSLELLFLAALFSSFITSFLTKMLTHLGKIQEDASIGLVFAMLFALGVVLVTVYSRNFHLGIEAILGNMDMLGFSDLKLITWVALMNGAFFLALFKELRVVAFDPSFARSIGVKGNFLDYLFLFFTSITSLAAFRAVGVFLFLAILVAPVLMARMWTHRLHTLIALSVAFSSLAALIGVALSRHVLSLYGTPLSTAALVVCVLLILFFVSLVCRTIWETWRPLKRLPSSEPQAPLVAKL